MTDSKNPGKSAVVCDETLASRPNRKLPTACKAFNVECLTLMEMLAREFPEEDGDLGNDSLSAMTGGRHNRCSLTCSPALSYPIAFGAR